MTTDAVPYDDPLLNSGVYDVPDDFTHEERTVDDDLYIFNDPRVRRALLFGAVGLLVLTAVVGLALGIEWFQVGRHQPSAEVTQAVVDPVDTGSGGGSIAGGFLKLGAGFLLVIGAAGVIGMRAVRPGRR